MYRDIVDPDIRNMMLSNRIDQILAPHRLYLKTKQASKEIEAEYKRLSIMSAERTSIYEQNNKRLIEV